MENIRLTIEGMSCGHCVASVERALKAVSGVASDTVRVGEANVTYDESRTDPASILAAVSATGFQARLAAAGR